MSRPASIFALASTLLTSGCWLAAIPRFKVIEHAVTISEVAGHWLLSPDSQEEMAVDGFAKKAGQEFVILLRPDGSCSCRTARGGQYVVRDGRWSTQYDPSYYYKNRLILEFDDGVDVTTTIALDSSGMVLFQPWGDPDDGVDLVYRKKEIGEPERPAEPSSAGAPEGR